MNSELYHHGVLGMKWGIRRYQPYPKGERVKGGKEIGEAAKVEQRSSSNKSKADLKKEKVTKSSKNNKDNKTKQKDVEEKKESKENKDSSNKKPSQMSDDELRSAIQRLQLEKQYADLFKSLNTPSPNQVKKGKSIVKDILLDIAESSARDIGKQLGRYALGTAINKMAKKEIVNPKKGQKDK